MANNIPNLPNRPSPSQEKPQGKGNFWLIVIIILVVGAILWPILRRDTPSDAEDPLLDSEFGTTTTVNLDDVSADQTDKAILTTTNVDVVKQTASVGNISAGAVSTDPMMFRVYFSNRKFDPQGLKCDVVYPVLRTGAQTPAVGRAALTELLKGPTPAEAANDIFTSLNPGTKLQSLTIDNGIARVDFSSELGKDVGGSCMTSAIRAQITATLKQFPTVKSVIISINGAVNDILQP